MTTKEQIEIMQAYLDGKNIQFRFNGSDEWSNLVFKDYSSWNWTTHEYRIKPEPKYRPYKDTYEMISDFKRRFKANNPDYTKPLIWVRGKYTGAETLITRYIANKAFVEGISHDMEQLFKNFEYLDGSKCGKLVE